jgi:subtilisin family serine protease
VVRSFVGDDGRDARGHGTMVAGLAAGPRTPRGGGLRFAVAPGANLLVAKVFRDVGQQTREGDVLRGLEWVLDQGADIVSCSLVFPQTPDADADANFTEVLARATQSGVLFVAAAGNDSYRQALVMPVRRPAAFDGALAIGAVGPDLGGLARFSNGASARYPRSLDLVAPGTQMLSAWHEAPGLRSDRGTSFATPLAAGVAALWAQRTGARGAALRPQLMQAARPLPGIEGNGLIRAPR